jgi:hypothetical protein
MKSNLDIAEEKSGKRGEKTGGKMIEKRGAEKFLASLQKLFELEKSAAKLIPSADRSFDEDKDFLNAYAKSHESENLWKIFGE